MINDIAGSISSYGLPLIFLIAFSSCLALPVPASLAFMAAGTFAASDELSLYAVWIAGLTGAVAGDQIGYLLAGRFAARYSAGLGPHWRKGLEKAQVFAEKWGDWSIFLSRWLASPLGPWVNFSSGMTDYPWRKFTLMAVLGEIVWVSIYIGIGYAFSDQAQAVADMVANAIWLILSGGLAILLGKMLFARQKRKAEK